MSIYRTNNPTEFDDVDQIVVDESAPPPSISGVSTGVALMHGQFETGPDDFVEISSLAQLQETFGKNNSYLGSKALQNKKFARLIVKRVHAAAAAKATLTLTATGPVNIITFTAKHVGVHGNSFKVAVAAGTTTGKKYTISDTRVYNVFPTEVYDNIDLTTYASEAAADAANIFAASKMVDANVLAVSANPDNAAATALASGSDGSVADSDYQTSINLGEAQFANIVFLDEHNATRNGYLKTHVANTQDRMAIVAGAESDSVSTAVSAVGSLRDTDGRLIYAYPWIKNSIDGVNVYTSPSSFAASLISQIGPNIDPAFAGNSGLLPGIIGLKSNLSRAEYITLKEAGIMAFEFDSDVGFKVKSGVTTQIANSAKTQILRRRMADYLTASAAKFLKNYQNAVNSQANRNAVKGAILSFVESQENLGLLPKDSETATKKAKLVDIKSLNSDSSIGQGFFYVIWKQRLYSSMRFIVLKAEIGETVTVTEAG